jgi:hypothetical protein
MRITSGGDVSIGSDHSGFSGYRVLNLRGGSTGGIYNLEDSSGTRTASLLNTGSDLRLQTFVSGGSIQFEPEGTERMRIDSSGNLVVGHTSAILSASNRGNVTINGANEAILSLGIGGSEGGYLYHDGTTQYLVNTKNGGQRFFTNNAEKMRINSTGEVGIGVTPVAHYTGYRALDIGTAMSLFSNSGSTNVATMTNNGYLNSSASQWTYKVTDEATMYSQVHGDHRFSTAVSGSAGGAISWLEKMRIDSSGRVLINRTSTAEGTKMDISHGTGWGLVLDSSGASGTNYHLLINRNGSSVGSITTTASATQFNTSSDARLKDVTGKARGLEVINKLNPVSYTWKKDGKAAEGLIAQEVIDIMPYAVSQNKKDNMYQMDYSKLVTPLIKAIQEQQAQIDALQSEINTLKGE